MFARMIANRPLDYGQVVEAISCAVTPKATAAKIAKRIDELVADKAVSAAALLFPELSDLEAMARTFVALADQPQWAVSTTTLQPPPTAEMVAVHIVRDIPFGNAACPSEVLVLGPFSEFAPTRRAPTTALEIYVGEPRALDPKSKNPTAKANLAHMAMGLPTAHSFNKVWDRSIEGRKKSLGGDDNRAKAKVSFVMPTGLAQKLGCAP